MLRTSYARRWFDAAAAGRILGQLRAVLEGLAQDSETRLAERRVGELPLLAAAERHQLLVEWSVAPGEEPEPAALRDRLRRKLAEPLIPAAFLVLDTLPRTADGRVARAMRESGAVCGRGSARHAAPVS